MGGAMPFRARSGCFDARLDANFMIEHARHAAKRRGARGGLADMAFARLPREFRADGAASGPP